MAVQAEIPIVTPPAQIVGNVFVEQYYHILHHSPELVHRFYQDSSVLSRPDSSGGMTSTTTMQGINEKILSLNYKDFIAEIKTSDAQQSLGDGVVVLVTGYLTGRDSMRKKFAQSFFLAPQEKGYYVLNDVFRYVEYEDEAETCLPLPNGNFESIQPSIHTRETEQPIRVVDPPEQVHQPSNDEERNNEPEVCDPSDIEDQSKPVEEVFNPPPTSLDHSQNVTFTSVPPISQDDEPKQSYASILKAMKTNQLSKPVRAPASNVKVKRPSMNQDSNGSMKPAPVSDLLPSKGEAGLEKIDVLDEGYSIYVRNLPQSATTIQMEEVFTKFGPIKQGGIQVRSNKQGFCFGFVEFESLSAMKSAIEASPVLVGTRKTIIEEKRATSRGPASPNNGRGRHPSLRGGFRSDSFRGCGGRGYGRNDFRGPSEFSGRLRGSAGRAPDGYQRVDQNGTENGSRQGGSS